MENRMAAGKNIRTAKSIKPVDSIVFTKDYMIRKIYTYDWESPTDSRKTARTDTKESQAKAVLPHILSSFERFFKR